jgi:hypothetical protein
MPPPIDVRLESLTRSASESPAATRAPAQPSGQGATFYIETFGCQMNVHDSEKVAGVLMSRGYQQVDSPEAAKLVFYNTCSIREKAAQKVFSRLGEFKTRQDSGKTIGVWPSRRAKKSSSARRG